jgi:hypothetical protein
MGHLLSGTRGVQSQSVENLTAIADYLRDMLLERRASADAAVLAEALESVERAIGRSDQLNSRSQSNSRNLSAA